MVNGQNIKKGTWQQRTVPMIPRDGCELVCSPPFVVALSQPTFDVRRNSSRVGGVASPHHQSSQNTPVASQPSWWGGLVVGPLAGSWSYLLITSPHLNPFFQLPLASLFLSHISSLELPESLNLSHTSCSLPVAC